MTTTTVTVHQVKAVRIARTMDLDEQLNREIRIELEDGKTIMLDLYTTNDELNVEIE